jgi:electron-transferring-flavoprotein dehydrogenase
MDVYAKITVLGEGPRGTLYGDAERRLDLSNGCQPQIYAVGVKELWEVPGGLEPGRVLHMMGFPLIEQYGGGFLYTLRGNLIQLGLVVGLDSRDPRTDGHRLLQEFKLHPWVRKVLQGGEAVGYGAKAIPEGGYYAMPRLYADGMLAVGDSVGFLNAQRLKGIHLAIKSGMLAAETAFEALCRKDYSADCLKGYQVRFEKSWACKELRKVRNFRQAFQSGFWRGLGHAAAQQLTRGRGIRDPHPIVAGHRLMEKIDRSGAAAAGRNGQFGFDERIALDKLSDLYLSDTAHEEDQPSHLQILDTHICDTKCTQEYGNPCQYFCPASVYEINPEASANKVKVNFSNCIHCKTCDIVDPYQVIRWTPPEGGGGPNWKDM